VVVVFVIVVLDPPEEFELLELEELVELDELELELLEVFCLTFLFWTLLSLFWGRRFLAPTRGTASCTVVRF